MDLEKSLGIFFLLIPYQNLLFEINCSEVSQMVISAVLIGLKDRNYHLHSLRIRAPYRNTVLFPLPPIMLLM